MVDGTDVGIHIDTMRVPVIAEAVEFGSMGFVPVGAHKNREFRQDMVLTEPGFDPVMRDILYDPQTSGGLLVGCLEKDVETLLQRLHDRGVEEAACVGYVSEDRANTIRLQ